ncbi:MAG: hypothetical protein Tsb009_31580 [Planctomycetaceae bacterium]
MMTHRAFSLCVLLLISTTHFSAERVQAQSPSHTQTLKIVGKATGFGRDPQTGVTYPAQFAGQLFRVVNGTDVPVGTYSEKIIQPILHPYATPLGFVGTIGLAKLTLEQDGEIVGELTAINLAAIVGSNGDRCKTDFAKGRLCARAQGIILQGTGIFQSMSGGFQTQSQLNMATFTLTTMLSVNLSPQSTAPPQIAASPRATCCKPRELVVTNCHRPLKPHCSGAGIIQTVGYEREQQGETCLLLRPAKTVVRGLHLIASPVGGLLGKCRLH